MEFDAYTSGSYACVETCVPLMKMRQTFRGYCVVRLGSNRSNRWSLIPRAGAAYGSSYRGHPWMPSLSTWTVTIGGMRCDAPRADLSWP